MEWEEEMPFTPEEIASVAAWDRARESVRVGRRLARELEETGSVRITLGSGDVFRDLGLEDWDGHEPEDL